MYVVIVSSVPVGCIDAEIEKVLGPFTQGEAQRHLDEIRQSGGYAEVMSLTK